MALLTLQEVGLVQILMENIKQWTSSSLKELSKTDILGMRTLTQKLLPFLFISEMFGVHRCTALENTDVSANSLC